MKLTKDKIKLVLEEIVKIREQEDTNAMIDEAQKLSNKLVLLLCTKAAAEKAGMETGMLRTFHSIPAEYGVEK